MQDSDNNTNDDSFNSFNSHRSPRNKKNGPFVLSLILLGTAFFFSIVMVMRSGGVPRILFVLLALLLGYSIYETITKYKSTNN